MTVVELRDIRKSYGLIEVVHGVTLDIADGEFVVFVGPSGCGKSTMLRMIAGLENITSGELRIDGKIMNEATPTQRGIAMVFQNYALYPNMTVYENMSFGLQQQGMPKAKIRELVTDSARTLKIEHLLDRRPGQLSGGQSQRVAIGRSIVRNPRIFLFDEPLSNLDAELRVHMRIEIARLHKELATTIIYVTHDQVEAMTLADKIVVLREGVVEQVGAPLTLYDDPDNLFVAGFIGSPKMNFLKGRVKAGRVVLPEFGDQSVPLPKLTLPPEEGAEVTIGIRPETFKRGGEAVLDLKVEIVEHLGDETYAYARQAGGQVITIAVAEGRGLRPGQTIGAMFDPSRMLLFSRSGKRIR